MNEDQTQNFRRLALSAWLKNNGGARKACIKNGMGKSVESHISQIIRGYSFGARAARNIETKLGIPHRLLDTIPSEFATDTMVVASNADFQSNEGLSKYLNGLLPTISSVHIKQFQADKSAESDVRVLFRHQPGQITDLCVSQEWLDKNVRGFTDAQNLCVVTGFGDSMQPLFKSGDPLLVDTGVNEFTSDSVYFFRIDGEGFVKRLQQIPGEGLRALSANTAYEAWTIKPEMDFQVYGRVVKAWHNADC
jgi:hypothetical protein